MWMSVTCRHDCILCGHICVTLMRVHSIRIDVCNIDMTTFMDVCDIDVTAVYMGMLA